MVHHFKPSRAKKYLLSFGVGTLSLVFLSVLLYSYLFGPAQKYTSTESFLIQPNQSVASVAHDLKEGGYIKSELAFRFAYAQDARQVSKHIRPGGFNISKSMDLWSITDALTVPPYLAWVTIPQGLRKEQVAAILADSLSWTPAQKDEWLTKDTASNTGFSDGIYYGDTYLIPTDQSPAQVAARLRGHFEDVFAPYAQQAANEGKDWNQVLILASLIEREAAKNDKALVAGILWNRVEIGMPLAVDATLQYIKGSEENKWWPVPHSADKFIESPYNTYRHVGLPPAPIDTPSVASVAAALNPDATDCLFYIHDNSHTIHCAPTYAGQQHNVSKYLK